MARRASSVRLRLLAGDLIRKGIVRPGVGGSVGAAHASSGNHSSRIDTAEARFGIISNVWMDGVILEVKVKSRVRGTPRVRGRGSYASKRKRTKGRNGETRGTVVCSLEIHSF